MTEKDAIEKAREICKSFEARLYNDEWATLTRAITVALTDAYAMGETRGREMVEDTLEFKNFQ